MKKLLLILSISVQLNAINSLWVKNSFTGEVKYLTPQECVREQIKLDLTIRKGLWELMVDPETNRKSLKAAKIAYCVYSLHAGSEKLEISYSSNDEADLNAIRTLNELYETYEKKKAGLQEKFGLLGRAFRQKSRETIPSIAVDNLLRQLHEEPEKF